MTDSPSLSRRKFVQMGTLGMLTLGMAACSDNDREESGGNPPPEPQANAVTPAPELFPQSVASGDPRADSVVFWTRIEVGGEGDVPVQLIVGTDSELRHVVANATLPARAEYDWVVKLKLMLLDPYTTYYYQFQYNDGSNLVGSKVGRTKTAPTPEMDVTARFGVISCQDYRERFYNTLAELANRSDIDFVVHLGDYIYETSASIALKQSTRNITFTHPEDAIELPSGILAARSVSNYRDLYKTYRSDPALQRLHEMHPMIATWDDHEFSNDSHGDVGTYFNGLRNEQDTQRRRDSERVYAEFMPIAFGLDANGFLTDGEEGLYPNTRIYRDFEYGQHLHLIMTDTRTYRNDHLIPEDAFPGTVVVDQPTLENVFSSQGIPFAAVAGNFAAYVDIDLPQLAPYKQVLTGVLIQALMADGISQENALVRASQQIVGKIALLVANPMIEAYNASNPPQPLPLLEDNSLPRGLAFALMGKTSNNSDFGSRLFVPKEAYDLYARVLYHATAGASEEVLGADQEQWLEQTLSHSTATWRVIGNSIPMASMMADFRSFPVPEAFKRSFYVSLDSWDGFGNKRRAILDKIAALAPQTALIAGDVHTNLVARHEHDIYEFTVGAVSSPTMKEFMQSAVENPPFSDVNGIGTLVDQVNRILLNSHPTLDSGERSLKYVRADAHGYMICEAGPNGVAGYYNLLPQEVVKTNHYEDPNLHSMFERLGFRLQNGTLSQEF